MSEYAIQPIRKTVLMSGDIQIVIEDDRLGVLERNKMAMELLRKTCVVTLNTRRKMGLDK